MPENLIDATWRNLDGVIAFQIPGYPMVPQVILLAQIEDLLLSLRRRFASWFLSAGLAIDQIFLAISFWFLTRIGATFDVAN